MLTFILLRKLHIYLEEGVGWVGKGLGSGEIRLKGVIIRLSVRR